jgi:hypothetical protein
MERLSLTKSIEADKLNRRTGVPTGEPMVTIPFGAIIENLVEDRDFAKFAYHGDPYRCPAEVIKVAATPIQPVKKDVPAATVLPKAAGPQASLQWERVQSSHSEILRAKVPGGWLLLAGAGKEAIAFYPDPEHRWDGASLP